MQKLHRLKSKRFLYSQRLAKNGPNEIINKPKNTRLQFLCEAFMTPFTSILCGIQSRITLVVGDILCSKF